MSVMLIKATRLHPGVPLQVYVMGMVVTTAVVDIVVAEVVADGVVIVEAIVVVIKAVVGLVNMVVITESTI